MFELTTEQVKTIMNEVKSLMDDGETFTRRDVFEYLKEYEEGFDDVCYCEIKDEFKMVVDQAVKEYDIDYFSEFDEDEDGKVVLMYKPYNEDEDEDTEFTNEQDNEADDGEDNDDFTDEEDEGNRVFLPVMSLNRVCLSNKLFERANIFDNEIIIKKDKDAGVITIRESDGEPDDDERFAYRSEKGNFQMAVKTTLGVEEFDEVCAEIGDREITLTR